MSLRVPFSHAVAEWTFSLGVQDLEVYPGGHVGDTSSHRLRIARGNQASHMPKVRRPVNHTEPGKYDTGALPLGTDSHDDEGALSVLAG